MFYPYEGYRSVTPLDAARVNRTIFHNHSVQTSKKTQNYLFFGDVFGLQICMTAPKIVFPDQGENWCRQS